eukprot:2869896-Rhodomonas_salina.2
MQECAKSESNAPGKRIMASFSHLLSSGICLFSCSAMPSTVCDAICYAMPGTDVAYGATAGLTFLRILGSTASSLNGRYMLRSLVMEMVGAYA